MVMSNIMTQVLGKAQTQPNGAAILIMITLGILRIKI